MKIFIVIQDRITNTNSYPEFPNAIKEGEKTIIKLRGNIDKTEERETDGIYYFKKQTK